MNIKINSKNYTVPQLGFKHMTQIEDMGFSVLEMLGKKQMFSIAAAFTGVVAGCDRATAENLVEQHVFGGGSIIPICETFQKAVDQSAFFKKFLEEAEEKATGRKKAKKETEKAEETAETD